MREADVRDWFQDNQNIIRRALTDERRRIIDLNLPDYDTDESRLLLSEMELCGATENIPLPQGYKVRHGLIGMEGNPKPAFHIFAANDNDEIIDVTAGQIVVNEKTQKPGDSIRTLISQAPHLFTVMGDVIALHGTVDEIRDNLGLKYNWLK